MKRFLRLAAYALLINLVWSGFVFWVYMATTLDNNRRYMSAIYKHPRINTFMTVHEHYDLMRSDGIYEVHVNVDGFVPVGVKYPREILP